MVSGTDREFNAYLYLWNLEKFSLILSHTPSTALLFSVDYISFSPMFRIRIICSHPIVPTLHNLTPHSYSTFLLHNLTSHSYSTTLHHILTPHSYSTSFLHIFSPHLLSRTLLHNLSTSYSTITPYPTPYRPAMLVIYIIPREACPMTPLRPSSKTSEMNNILVDIRVRQEGSSAKRKLSK